jgi:hypothetical protein
MTAATDSFWVRYSQAACHCRPDYLCPFCRHYGVTPAPPDLLAAIRNLRLAGLISDGG